MIPFERTVFYRILSPYVLLALQRVANPNSRSYLCGMVLSVALVLTVDQFVQFGTDWLGDPADGTFASAVVIGLRGVQIGSWFWGIWYGLYRIVRFSHGTPFGLAPRLFSCVITGALVMVVMTRIETPDYPLLVRGIMAVAFGLFVLLPTVWTRVSR